MTAPDRYRALRKADPYLSSLTAWGMAVDAERATAAGISGYAERDPVTIDGRPYLLTVESDDQPLDGDCFGTVTDRETDDWENPRRVVWPCVPLPAGSDGVYQGSYRGPLDDFYDPGEHYEAESHRGWLRRRMGRHDAWLRQRAELIADGLRLRDSWPIVVILEDPADGAREVMGNIDVRDRYGTETLADLWELLSAELVHELIGNRADRAERARDLAESRAAEALSAGLVSAHG